MDILGIRVRGIPPGTKAKDISEYFGKPQNGGAEIDEMYYPLLDNDAVIIFTNDGYQHAFNKSHTIGGKSLALNNLPIQIFSNSSVYLEQAITQLLDENPPLMRSLENDSDVEVVFDAKFMTYRVSGNPFQIEWASKFLTDAWIKQKDDRRPKNGATNRVAEKKGNTESRRSPAVVISEDSDSSEIELSYKPLDSQITFKSKQNDRDMGQRSSPSPSHFSTISKKTKKSDDYERNIPPYRPSSSETYHQTPNVKFNPQVLENMNSCLNVSDCRVSVNDRRSSRSPTNAQRDDFAATRPKKQTLPKRQNLTDNDKYTFPRTIPNQSVTATSEKTPLVFKNYESDSDEEGTVITKPNPELSSFRDSAFQRPPSRNPYAAFPRLNRTVQTGMSLSQSDFPDLALEYETSIGSVNVRLIIGDILTQKTDAVISPANTDLSSLYGISALIARNADRNMRKECADYIAKNGNLLFGDVIHTCAGGNLDPKVTYILHAAVPSWREDSPEQSSHLLICAYLNCFQYADKIWLRSLSMPIMGAGHFGAPLDVCVQSFHDAILLFTHGTNESKHLQEIQLVSNNQNSACSSVVVFKSLMDLNEEEARKAAVERYYKRSKQYEFSARDFVLRRDSSEGEQYQDKDHDGKTDRVEEGEEPSGETSTDFSSKQTLKSEDSEKMECSKEEEGDQSSPTEKSKRDNESSPSRNKQHSDSQDETKDSWTISGNQNRNLKGYSQEYAQAELFESDLHKGTSQGPVNVSPAEYTEVDETPSSSVIEKLLTRCGSNENIE